MHTYIFKIVKRTHNVKPYNFNPIAHFSITVKSKRCHNKLKRFKKCGKQSFLIFIKIRF